MALYFVLACSSSLAAAPLDAGATVAAPGPSGKGRPAARLIVPQKGKVCSAPAGCEVAADADRSNGNWTVRTPTPEQPGICTFDVGQGPSRLLLYWQSSGNAAAVAMHRLWANAVLRLYPDGEP